MICKFYLNRMNLKKIFLKCMIEFLQNYTIENMSEINENFGFLYGSSLMDHSIDYIQKCAADISLKYETDFISEIKDFKCQAFSLLPDLRAATPLALLQLITTYSLRAEYPNVETALRIFLTLPITVATCERSFSKLKAHKKLFKVYNGTRTNI